MDLRAWGIDAGYHDNRGAWCEPPPETLDAVAGSMGALDGTRGDGPAPAPVLIIRRGTTASLARPAELHTEDGETIPVGPVLPPDLPLGYHELVDDAGTRPLVISPGRCVLPPASRVWGWAVQLYAARSEQSWGIGDLGDLRRLARWSAAELGAGMVLVSPLGAAAPGVPQQPSPYYPCSRRYRNPLYLRVEDMVEAAGVVVDLGDLAVAGRALNARRRIDRDAVFDLKMRAAERVWRAFAGDARHDRYRSREGDALTAFATFCALAEEHGPSWLRWPAELHDPMGSAVGAFRRAHADRVAFHAWLQWMLEEQFAVAAAELRVVCDLPIGFDPGGADAWEWRDVLCDGMRIGAPPDEFNPAGQDWGLPPFDPWRLRAAAYRPFAETVRAVMRHAGGLRIDHVMGLFRLFWIPEGAPPAAGTYVRYPADDLLDILALESHRAGAHVVGEDLGTVEPGVREALAARDILSTRLLWFEQEPPERYPPRSLAAVTTHDLATIAGVWTGEDLDVQQRLALAPDAGAADRLHQRLGELAGVGDDAAVEEVVVRAHARLSGAPSALVTATLDDALAVRERPNHPGTVDEWPNWRLALPLPLEAVETQPLVRRVASAMRRTRSTTPEQAR